MLPDYAALIREFTGDETPVTAVNDTDRRILDATRDLVGTYGERRVTIDDIAAAARVGRATVFRRFGSKEQVLARMYERELREASRLLRASLTDPEDAVDAITQGFLALLEHAQSHPVSRHLASAEPERLVAQFRDGEPPGLQLLRTLLVSLVADLPGSDELDTRALDELADLLGHLILAYQLVPRSEHPDHQRPAPEIVRRIANAVLAR
ncbi:MAG: TetR/AcrR family transcriptional regulator [Chloroflexi bacterium]|nr:TetR/AcrR family transcriptional regulator [Chloroflexota bacterium]